MTSRTLPEIRTILLDPRKLLLADAIGAALTAAGVYLLSVWDFIGTGLPRSLLAALAIAATCFALFDIVAFSRHLNARVCLRIIAGLNSGYCIVVLVSMALHRSSLTLGGAAYFGIEIAIVFALAVWEIMVSLRRDS